MAVIKNQRGKRVWVSWLSLESATHIADWANWIFVTSLVAGVISTIVIIGTTNVKEWYWERDRLESRERVAAAELKTEKLRKELGPRNIRSPELEQMAAALSQLSGISYDLTLPPITDHGPLPQLLEPGSFLVGHLIVVLSKFCGWQLRSVEGTISKAALPSPIAALQMDFSGAPDGQRFFVPSVNVGQLSGIVGVRLPIPKEEKSREATFALAKALNDIGIWAEFDLPPPYNNIPADALTGGAVHIVIGTKP